jgi:hypothetical protein
MNQIRGDLREGPLVARRAILQQFANAQELCRDFRKRIRCPVELQRAFAQQRVDRIWLRSRRELA